MIMRNYKNKNPIKRESNFTFFVFVSEIKEFNIIFISSKLI